MSKRQQQKAATQARLLQEAKRLFIEQGYETTTTRQVAKACGVSIGTVFAHFSDKSALLKAILYQDIEQALNDVRRELTPQTDAFAAYLAYARRLYRFYGEHPPLSQTLLAHGLFQYAEFEQQLQSYMAELTDRLVTVDGCPESDAKTIAYNLMANYFLVLIGGLGRPENPTEQWVEQLRELIVPLQDWVQQRAREAHKA